MANAMMTTEAVRDMHIGLGEIRPLLSAEVDQQSRYLQIAQITLQAGIPAETVIQTFDSLDAEAFLAAYTELVREKDRAAKLVASDIVPVLEGIVCNLAVMQEQNPGDMKLAVHIQVVRDLLKNPQQLGEVIGQSLREMYAKRLEDDEDLYQRITSGNQVKKE